MSGEFPISCGGCGQPLGDNHDSPHGERTPCPCCGSLARRHNVSVSIAARVNVFLGLKHKRPKTKRPVFELVHGMQLRRAAGDLVHKERIIDREGNRYREVVTLEDGTIIRDVDEALSTHTGHGSAKRK